MSSPSPAANASPAQAAHKANRDAQVTVLGYHRFVTKVRHPGTEITPADFEAQMRQLKDHGIHVIPLRDLLAWKRGEKAIPEKSAVITLDDGWKSQYEVAWPILKKFGYPFTLFVYTDYIKGGPKSGGGSMSWEQLAELRDAGASIEDHTASHHDLRGGKRGAAHSASYEKWLWNELHGSKQLLEQRLGIRINALALPYGYYNRHVTEVAKKAGYEAIFTVNGQKITSASPPLLLGRSMIDSGKPKIFADAVRFGEPSGGPTLVPAPVAELGSAALAPQPANGSTVHDPRPVIKASLASFAPFDPGSPVMRVSGLGIVPAKYDPASRTLSYRPPEKLPQSTYAVIVSTASHGKKREGRWSFTVAPEAASPASRAAVR